MSQVCTETPEARMFFDRSMEVMVELYFRWQDEREYEDFADYILPVRPIAEECGVLLLGMTKRPFAVKFAVDGKVFVASVTSKCYRYKRVA